jgi:hypothetical protein
MKGSSGISRRLFCQPEEEKLKKACVREDSGSRFDQCPGTGHRHWSLDVAVLAGYPGRSPAPGSEPAVQEEKQANRLPFWLLPSSPLDQFIISHPDYFLPVRRNGFD